MKKGNTVYKLLSGLGFSQLFPVVALGLGLLFPDAVSAGPIIIGGSETLTSTYYNANHMNGYDFVSTTNQSVTALGFWDQASNGLPGSFQVGLWNTSSQTLLASVVIDNTDPIDSSVTVVGGQWRYETLPIAVSLNAGATYTLAWQTGSADLTTTDSLVINYPSLSTAPSVVIPDLGRFLGTSGFTFPIGTQVAGNVFRGMVNAQLSSIPEPASILLLGFGAFGLYLRRRRQS